MKKKLVVLVLSAVLCFAAFASLAGCSDSSELESRIAQLEQELEELRQNNSSGGGFDGTLKIYELGDTAVVYNGTVPIYQFTYVSKTAAQAAFTIKNISIHEETATKIGCYVLNMEMQFIDEGMFLEDLIESSLDNPQYWPIGEQVQIKMPINSDYSYMVFTNFAAWGFPLAVFKF
ncbi:MAG: hypothetical protein FWH03_01995 [Firmicutes bacterium]|nr:hypothetical protein [Bacillota bacterium]